MAEGQGREYLGVGYIGMWVFGCKEKVKVKRLAELLAVTIFVAVTSYYIQRPTLSPAIRGGLRISQPADDWPQVRVTNSFRLGDFANLNFLCS